MATQLPAESWTSYRWDAHPKMTESHPRRRSSKHRPVVEYFTHHANPSRTTTTAQAAGKKLHSASRLPPWFTYLVAGLHLPPHVLASPPLGQAWHPSLCTKAPRRRTHRSSQRPTTSTSPGSQRDYQINIMARKSSRLSSANMTTLNENNRDRDTGSIFDGNLAQPPVPTQHCEAQPPMSGQSEAIDDNRIRPSTPAAISSPLSKTPEPVMAKGHTRGSSDSSDLSSAPSVLGITPNGLLSPPKRSTYSIELDRGSPVRRSNRKRKISTEIQEEQNAQTTKRRKSSESVPRLSRSVSQPAQLIGEVRSAPSSENGRPKQAIDEAAKTTMDNNTRQRPNTRARNNETLKQMNLQQTSNSQTLPSIFSSTAGPPNTSVSTNVHSQFVPDKKAEAKFYKDLKEELHGFAVNKTKWPEFTGTKLTLYGADATTVYTSSSADTSQSSSPNKQNVKPPSRSNGRGGGNFNGRGRGGRGRGGNMTPGRGRGDDMDPTKKSEQEKEDDARIHTMRKRQMELRKLFSVIGAQQKDLLENMATRDINKLAKKSKAHKQVPEYDTLLEELAFERCQVQDLIRREYQLKIELETQTFEREEALIEERYRQHIDAVKEEHIRGAAGDIALLKKAFAAQGDDNGTQDGSEADYFPQYHEIPESDAKIRGYHSSKITDERPFKVGLPSFDEMASRDIIEDEITRPDIERWQREQAELHAELERKNAERKAEERLKQSQTMTALTAEAEKQLNDIKGYLIPRPLRLEQHANSFALSQLADAAEYMAQAYPHNQYIFMPLPAGQQFPREALNFEPLPGVKAQPRAKQTRTSTKGTKQQQSSADAPKRATTRTGREKKTHPTHGPPELSTSTSQPITEAPLPVSGPASITTTTPPINPPGPSNRRQIVAKPALQPQPATTNHTPNGNVSPRKSFRSLAPQPPPAPPTQTSHQQQFTFVTPQQPPQGAQFVPAPVPGQFHHRIAGAANNGGGVTGVLNGVRGGHAYHHHHSLNQGSRGRQGSGSGSIGTPELTTAPNMGRPGPRPNPLFGHRSGHLLAAITAANAKLNTASSSAGAMSPVGATTSSTPTGTSAPGTGVIGNPTTRPTIGKIPMQFVNTTPESARGKYAAQYQANAQAQALNHANSQTHGSNGGSTGNGNGNGNGNTNGPEERRGSGNGGKGRVLLPKP